MTEHPEIVIDPNIRFGQPTIRGTRITVEDVLRLSSRGLSPDEIMEQYPGVTAPDVRAAHEYAADLVHDKFAVRPEAAE